MQQPRGGASIDRANALFQAAMGLSAGRSDPTRPYRDMRLAVGAVENGAFSERLSLATGAPDLCFAVARGEVDVAAINPSPFLTMAVRGTGPFPAPLPLRALAVLPSWDRMGFAVAEKTGLTSIAEIAARKYPLRLSIRLNPMHASRFAIDEVIKAAGFTLDDLASWGGQIQYVSTPSDEGRLQGMANGTLDAVFDEGIKGWGPIAVSQGMRLLTLDEPTIQHLEAIGWPVGPLTSQHVPGLPGTIQTASFSGWPILSREDLPDTVAYELCAGLDAGRGRVHWDVDGGARLEDFCGLTEAAPLGVPLHPGAERYYREHGCLA